jgi:hypothetical protein
MDWAEIIKKIEDSKADVYAVILGIGGVVEDICQRGCSLLSHIKQTRFQPIPQCGDKAIHCY